MTNSIPNSVCNWRLDIPGSVGKSAFEFGLKALEDLRVRGLRTAPQLDCGCPHRLENTFVEENFVGEGELGAST